MPNDGNNVDIDREMALLAETLIRYNAIVRLQAGKYEGLLRAICEGR
jgi:flagellar basal body rod protein FlgB